MDQEKQTKNPKINPHIYGQILCDKGAKTIRWGRIIFSTNGAGETGNAHVKERSWTLISQESCRMVVSWTSVVQQCACGRQYCTVYLEVVLRVNLMHCDFLPPKKILAVFHVVTYTHHMDPAM